MTTPEPDRREAERVRVVEAHMTCPAYPSQWEGTTDDGRVIYARYRHGELTVGVGATQEAAIYGAMQFTGTLGEHPEGVHLLALEPDLLDDGYMTPEELVVLTRHVVAWPWDWDSPTPTPPADAGRSDA